MTKSLLILTLSIILISCNENQKTKNPTEVLTSTISKTEFEDLIGNTYKFDYSKYKYHIKIESDTTIYWKLVDEDSNGTSEGSNKYIHSQINKNIFFISWTEESGLELYNILNFENNTLTTHGNANGYMFINPGVFMLVE